MLPPPAYRADEDDDDDEEYIPLTSEISYQCEKNPACSKDAGHSGSVLFLFVFASSFTNRCLFSSPFLSFWCTFFVVSYVMTLLVKRSERTPATHSAFSKDGITIIVFFFFIFLFRSAYNYLLL